MLHIRRACFTLVELLVVVAIISILAALLLPALNRGLAQARTISCLGNLQQIGVGHQSYTNDYNSFVVPAEWRNDSDWGGTWTRWGGAFARLRYLDIPTQEDQAPPERISSVLACPEGIADAFVSWPASSADLATLRPQRHQVMGEKYWLADKKVVLCWYGNNGNSSASGTPNWRIAPDNDKHNWKLVARYRRIVAPSRTVSNFDGLYATNNSTNCISRRHNQGNAVNLLFWDGHAASVNSIEVPPPDKSFSWMLNKTNLNTWNPDIKWLVDQ